MVSLKSSRLVIGLLLAALALAACGGKTTLEERNFASAFNLSVAPESFLEGGSAELGLAVSEADDLVHVDVVATGAIDLKALFFELGYDRDSLHPVSAEPTELLGSEDLLLTLTLLDKPQVQFAAAVHHPQVRPGFSGDGALARISFARGPAPAVRGASETTHDNRSRTTLTVNTGTGELRWLYYNVGDCDQNREVFAADLALIASNFGTTGGPFPAASQLSVIDCDNNGEIGQPDIAPIAANYRNIVEGYNVYESDSPAAYPTSNDAPSTITPVATVPLTEAQGAPNERKFFTLGTPDFTYDPSMYYWVRPFHGTDEGTPSTLLNPQAVGNPPIIDSITATPPEIFEGETSTITVVATDPEAGPLTYSYGASQGNITGFGASVTYNAPATVAAPTNVTITVTVTDEDDNQTQDTVNVLVSPVPEFTVHIAFTPAAHAGNGTLATPYVVMEGDIYTFTAEDGDGNDITAEVTFDAIPEPGEPPFGAPNFAADQMEIDHQFYTRFHVVGIYHEGLPDEVTSDPDAAGEEMHFTMQFSGPASI